MISAVSIEPVSRPAPAGRFSIPLIADLPCVDLSGIRLHGITEEQVCQQILDQSDSGQGGFVVTANLDHLRRCQGDVAYRKLVSRADLVVADGMPLIWASRIQGTPLPQRVAGSSLSLKLAESLAGAGKSLFLLGGNPGVAERAAGVLTNQFPGLTICDTHCPPFGFEQSPREMQQIRDKLHASNPDVVYVALGSPKQEMLIEALQLQFPGTWWLGIGITLSFVTGEVPRAPIWVQRAGFEWAHRLAQEPRRLYRRYLVEGIPFASRLFLECGRKRISSRREEE